MMATLLFILAQAAPQNRDEVVRQDIEGAIKKLGSERHTDSFIAKEELVDLGKRAVPAVVAELNKAGTKASVRVELCDILGRIRDGNKEAVDALVKKLDDQDEYGISVASAAARALGSIADDAAIPALVKSLGSKATDTDKILKHAIVHALGVLRAREGVEGLKKALEDRKTAAVGENDENAHTIAAAAADALGLIRDAAATEDLGKLLGDVTPEPSSGQSLGWHAARALQRILGHELAGKAVKDEPRAGALSGDAKEVNDTVEAWKKWWDTRKTGKSIADAKVAIAALAAAVEAFKKEQGRYPEILDYLKKKPTDAKTYPEKGYYAGELKDGWGRPYVYRAAGTGAPFDILSQGKDGLEWGGGENADLWNHDLWKAVKKEENKKRLQEAVAAINRFKTDQGMVPKALHDLSAKPGYPLQKPWPDKGYTVEPPKDAFGRYFAYNPMGTGGEPFDLVSHGADHAEGGADIDEDLWNHDKRPPPPKKDEKK